jgi:glycosyltransferase involved in cell wall biosynthesis
MYHPNLAATLVASVGTARPALVWGIRSSLEAPYTYRRLTRLVIGANRWLSARPSRIVYNSEASARQHAEAGFESRGARVIANGIDVQRFAPLPGVRARVRASLGLRDDELVVGNAARFDPSKDHAALLRAFAQLSAIMPAARLVLCGSQVDESNPALVALMAELGIRERVVLLGERTDVPDVMRAWDLGLNASVREGFPNMIAECMACGVPCVATGAGDTREIVGDAGYVAGAGDAAGLRQALLRAAELPASERETLGRAARARIERRFSAGRMIREYLELYAGIAKPARAGQAGQGS